MSTAVVESTPTTQTTTVLAGSETETAKTETPSTETKVDEVKKESKPDAKDSLLSGLRVVTPHTPDEPVKEESTKVDPKKEDPAKVEGKVEAKPEESKSREQFKRAEEAKKTAQAEAEALKKQLEEAKSAKPDAELQKRYDEQAAELAKTRAELRTAAIERDPDFQEKYVKAEERRTGELRELAETAGFTAKEFNAAFLKGDEDKLSEIEGALDNGQKRKWNSHLLKIEEIRDEKKQALAESEKTWNSLQEKHKENFSNQAKETIARNSNAASAALDELLQMAPGVKADTDLLEELRETFAEVAGERENSSKWTTQEIIKTIGESKILTRAVINLGKITEEQKARISELEEKLSEAEKFVQDYTNGAPKPGGVSTAKTETTEGSMLSRVSVKIPGR